jgi:hypothetical protein
MVFFESKMHKLMRYDEITSGPTYSHEEIQTKFKHYLAHDIGKRFMDYMCDDCWG